MKLKAIKYFSGTFAIWIALFLSTYWLLMDTVFTTKYNYALWNAAYYALVYGPCGITFAVFFFSLPRWRKEFPIPAALEKWAERLVKRHPFLNFLRINVKQFERNTRYIGVLLLSIGLIAYAYFFYVLWGVQ